MSSKPGLLQSIRATLVKYYPVSVEFEDSAYKSTCEHRRLENLKRNTSLHNAACVKLAVELEDTFGAKRIQDDTYESLYPSYHFRVLATPKTAWPERVWNWDYDFAVRVGFVGWLDLFVSYIGPFFTVVGVELKHEAESVVYRYIWPNVSPRLSAECHRVGRIMEVMGKNIVSRKANSYVWPDIAGETDSSGNAATFALLFNDTYPQPDTWNGRWKPLQEFAHLRPSADEEPKVGSIILEATIRNGLGTIAQ